MKTHQKKIAPQWYDLQLRGLKDWEIRVNDCDYQAGDRIILKEYDGHYTGNEMVVIVTNVATNVPYLPNNVVVLSTRKATPEEHMEVYVSQRRESIS